jgi:hypothetical protein
MFMPSVARPIFSRQKRFIKTAKGHLSLFHGSKRSLDLARREEKSLRMREAFWFYWIGRVRSLKNSGTPKAYAIPSISLLPTTIVTFGANIAICI